MSGFDEAAYDCWHCKAKAKYILSLTGRGLELSKRIAELEGDNARLRDSLKRLEWWNEKPGTGQDGRTNIYHYYFICGGCQEDEDGHDEDCWLAAELEEGK